MKLTLTALVLVLSCLVCTSQNSRIAPPHMQHAQQLQAENEASFPAAARSAANPDALRLEAEQLAQLAGSLPADIRNVNKGLLSKDLAQKLKQIEKLSKHLRAELNH